MHEFFLRLRLQTLYLISNSIARRFWSIIILLGIILLSSLIIAVIVSFCKALFLCASSSNISTPFPSCVKNDTESFFYIFSAIFTTFGSITVVLNLISNGKIYQYLLKKIRIYEERVYGKIDNEYYKHNLIRGLYLRKKKLNEFVVRTEKEYLLLARYLISHSSIRYIINLDLTPWLEWHREKNSYKARHCKKLLGILKKQYKNHKEIDHLLDRVFVIDEHIDLKEIRSMFRTIYSEHCNNIKEGTANSYINKPFYSVCNKAIEVDDDLRTLGIDDVRFNNVIYAQINNQPIIATDYQDKDGARKYKIYLTSDHDFTTIKESMLYFFQNSFDIRAFDYRRLLGDLLIKSLKSNIKVNSYVKDLGSCIEQGSFESQKKEFLYISLKSKRGCLNITSNRDSDKNKMIDKILSNQNITCEETNQLLEIVCKNIFQKNYIPQNTEELRKLIKEVQDNPMQKNDSLILEILKFIRPYKYLTYYHIEKINTIIDSHEQMEGDISTFSQSELKEIVNLIIKK